ncbi:uncharacterized protein LOC121374056 [Gigantopelta aegis]|uniref:uncharacterized protein LOC121374056 n=1 Tax=Gigantopelta aegis TaxID=1735272 RepID=UPI001B8895C6|nr:uncharacterized protein LOC121374056 [Gigantopelta aegis]
MFRGMKVIVFFVFVGIVGDYHIHAVCPVDDMVKNVQHCMTKMMSFVQAEESQRMSKCPDLEEGITCVDKIIDNCKDNPAISDQYTMLKDEMAQSRRDFHSYCNSAVTFENAKQLIFVCLAVSLFKKSVL